MSLRDRALVSHDRGRLATVAVAVAVLSAAYLTVGLLALLPSPGGTVFRVALFAGLVAIAWSGVVGAVLDRPPAVIVAAVALLLLGFWQAVLWIFMLPASLGLAIAGVLLAHAP